MRGIARGRALAAVLVMIVALLAGTSLLPGSRAVVLFVGGGGPGNYTAIQSAVDDATAGDTVFVFNGTYYEHVLLNKSISLRGESNIMTVIDGGGNGSAVTITADWVNVSGFTLTQSEPTWDENVRGIDVVSVQRCSLTDNRISYNAYAIHLLDSDSCTIASNMIEWNTIYSVILASSHGNTLQENDILGGYVGLDLLYSGSNLVTGNSFESHTYWGLGISGSNNVVMGNSIAFGGETCVSIESSGNVIDGNSIGGCGWGSWAGPGPAMYVAGSSNKISSNYIGGSGYGISLGGTDHLVIGNHISDVESTGISVLGSGNRIESNTISGVGGAAVGLWHTTANTLIGNSMGSGGVAIFGDQVAHWNTHSISTSNTVKGKPLHYWKDVSGGIVPPGAGQVILANCNGVTVRDQEITSYHGVSLGFSDANTIENISINAGRFGAYLYSSYDNTISDLTVTGAYGYSRYPGTYGIYLWKSGGNTISSAHLIHNQDGIRLYESHWNTITGILAEEGNWTGVAPYDSIGNVITSNRLMNNGVGIKSVRSGNEIYHNSLIDNIVQATDDSNAIQWDDGYPSGGNYWSDYSGIDVYSGPLQNQPGSDGIGDTPYIIDADSQDRYPLMFPKSISPPTATGALLSGGSLENVTVVWSLSKDDGAGNHSVVGYSVYRASMYDHEGQGYSLVASLPAKTGMYVDVNAGSGDPSNYFYRVCAVDSSGNEACHGQQGAKFTRPLSPGPQLVSLPLIQSSESAGAVLRTVPAYQAWTYDPWAGSWASLTKSKTYLTESVSLNRTMGLWVNPATECDLTVAGIVPLQTVIYLREGWNLVGFPSFNLTYRVSDLKATVPVDRVETSDPTSPPNFLRLLNDADFLDPGDGYWVMVSSDAVWTVVNK